MGRKKKDDDGWRQRIRLSGLMMRPCFMTVEEYESGMRSTEVFLESDFMKKYRDLDAHMSIVAMCAKLYIVKNWERVVDWSGLEVEILDNTGRITSYYNHDKAFKRNPAPGREDSPSAKFFKRMEEEEAARHNPITTMEWIVLDPTDGDFSIKINGKEHLWIDDGSVIIIADYVEDQLKPKDDVAVQEET